MTTSRRPNLGVKLLAAGLVLALGAAIQRTQGEPMMTLLAPAIILTSVGIKLLWRQRSGGTPGSR